MIVLRAFVAAFSFLTVLPFGRLVTLDGRDVARGSVLFPVVGGAIGALTGGLAWVLGDHLPPLLAAVLAVAAGVAVTGALHLDGLADCADGFGGRTPDDRLRIMRDHTIGTYGASALLLDLMIRVSVLAAVAGSKDALLFSVAAGALSRVAGPVLAARLPYAQAKPGPGEALSAYPGFGRAIAAAAIGLGIAAACLLGVGTNSDGGPIGFVPAYLAAAAVLVLVGMLASRRLGGITGDVMGAASELVEVAVLVALVASL